MSFSAQVKEELVRHECKARHCQIAELASILTYSDSIKIRGGGGSIEFGSDTQFIVKRSGLLVKNLLEVSDISAANDKILQMIKFSPDHPLVNPIVIKSICCKRAYLRGAFIGCGSMSDPQKGYHLEFACLRTDQANQLVDALAIFDIKAKMVQRKKYQVVYIKESEEIVELLNVIGAHVCLMDLENLRILKDMRNSINRRVNCEAANITKTVNAATKQIDDIEYIREHYGFENLTESLREIAVLRLELPEATLSELGANLDIGKSGVNHRLRKLSEIAEQLREGLI